MQSSTKCGNCKKGLPDEKGADRKPCPYCGSLVRDFGILIQETITIHAKVGLKKFTSGKKKAQQEAVIGDDLHRDTGEWRKLERNIDRENDRYTETVINSAGNVVNQSDEPLSKHRGHGNAKKEKLR